MADKTIRAKKRREYTTRFEQRYYMTRSEYRELKKSDPKEALVVRLRATA